MKKVVWFFSLGTAKKSALYTASEDVLADLRAALYGEEQPEVVPYAEALAPTTGLLQLLANEPTSANIEFRFFSTTETEKGTDIFAESVKQAPPWAQPALESEDFHEFMGDRRDADAIWNVVRSVLTSLDGVDGIVLETTSGIRSISTGFLLATGLLQALRPQVKVLAVTYAEFGAGPELDGKKTSPIYDLRPFLKLFDWAYGASSLVTRLDVGPLADLVAAGNSDLRGQLDGFARALDLGWPADLIPPLRSLTEALTLPSAETTPAHDVTRAQVQAALEPLTSTLPAAGRESDVTFWLEVVDRLNAAGRYGDAIRVLREAMVNQAIAESEPGSDWRDPKVRYRAETLLFRRSSQAVKSLWDETGRARNAASHAKSNLKHQVGVDDIRMLACDGSGRLEALRSEAWFRDGSGDGKELTVGAKDVPTARNKRDDLKKEVHHASRLVLVDLPPADEHEFVRIRHDAGLDVIVVRNGVEYPLRAPE